ncbi:uncharacterized protein LOC132737076 [Ruditapes philippinarum]|uniref:uncharacterized protein LOC132737076 n=1 Tax=Ruditapes philippinarum TaxID=129788 RepID=UPI00295AF019|nr:uncharacterized protein LOC132737076 [Ruditapes philippinarum]
MANTKAIVEGKIAGKKVMVFSKSYCPYCKLGKKTIEAYLGKELNSDDYEVWEIENESNCGEIQSVLGSITGGQTVPRIFINGKFVGGGSEVQALDQSGELRKLLS